MSTVKITTTSSAGTTRAARHRVRWIGLLMLAAAPLASCSDKSVQSEHDANAARIEQIDGSELSRVTLTAAAAKRLDLSTAKVAAGSATGTEIPYAAVLYDPDGHTWTFTKVKGLTFERKAITVDDITGDVASLSSGPTVGTEVVTRGATELYGAEIGVGDE